MSNVDRKVVVVGGGPAGLMAATQLINAGFQVTIVDHKATVGRKFLVAGDGGFNLTHSEPLEQFIERYDHVLLQKWVNDFTPDAFRSWLQEIGISTIVGSSGKVFPAKGIKPVEVLRAWINYLANKGVQWKLKTQLIDFSESSVRLQSKEQEEECNFDYLIIATGGGSWKKTGSDGQWMNIFTQKAIPVKPFQSGNSGLVLPMTDWLRKNEGCIIKNISLNCQSVKVAGDLVITQYGLEGKPAYAVNRPLRENNFQGLTMDLKPQFPIEKISEIFQQQVSVRKAWSALRLPEALYDWLRESLTKEQFTSPETMAQYIKAFPIEVEGLRPLDEVISTVGGVAMDAINETGKLSGFENIYCCGEMLDWDAPTGGYLIQGCVASGYAVGKAIVSLS